MATVEKVIEKINNGEFEEAKRHIHTIKNSGLEEDIYVLAEQLVELGYLEEAIGLYEQLLAVHPDEGELLLSLAEIYMEIDREDEALELVQKVKTTDAVYPSALLLEADLYTMNGLDEVAYAKLKKAKQLLPDEMLIDFALGEQLYMQGSFMEAISSYENVLKQAEEVAGISIHQRIAEAYSNIGQFEEALAHFEKSLQQKTELHTLFQYGLTAYQAGHYKTAVDKLEEVKAMDHEYHSLYMYLGGAYEHLNDLEKAYGTLQEGIKVDEFNKEQFLKAGKLALKLKDPEAAERNMREALAVDPGYLEAALTLAKFFLAEDRYSDCKDIIEYTKESGESDPQFDWLLAQALHGMEEYEEAKHFYAEASKEYNDSEEFLREYGFFLLEEGDRAKAGEIFNRLLERSPWNEEYISVIESIQGE